MSDTYRWTHVKTRPCLGGLGNREIITIDLSRAWKWHEYAEIVVVIIGLVCWALVWHGLCVVLVSVMVTGIICGIDIKPYFQSAHRFLSRSFTICELIAFLGIIALPLTRLLNH